MVMSPQLTKRVAEAHKIVAGAVKRHSPKGVVGLFSGGHDSLCATHIASQHLAFRGAASFHTTIGISETIEWRREIAQKYQWRHQEYWPPRTYEQLVLQYGFPGPGAHQFMYSLLKERCLRQMMRKMQRKPGDRVVLVTGVRLSESKRRMGHVKPCVREGGKVWTAPILNWTDEDKDEYMAFHQLPRNPVVDRVCMSGECLCGAFASPGEIAELEVAYPEIAAEIHALEVKAKAAGVHCVWGTRPPGERKPKGPTGPMCHSCDLKRAAA